MHVQSIRSDDAFKLFWQNVVLKTKNLDVEEPTLHRRRKVPRRYEVGNSTPMLLRSVQKITIELTILRP